MECHVYCFWPIEKELNRALCNNDIYLSISVSSFKFFPSQNILICHDEHV